MGSISQRSCHAYLPLVKYDNAEEWDHCGKKEREREGKEGGGGRRRKRQGGKQFQRNYEKNKREDAM